MSRKKGTTPKEDATMTEDKSWVWQALERMAALAVQQEEAETEAKRLASVYAGERERVTEAVPDLSIDGAIQAIRVLGRPSGTTTAAPACGETAAPAPTDDPLAIPPYLRRGDDSVEAPARGTLQNDAEALAQRPPPT